MPGAIHGLAEGVPSVLSLTVLYTQERKEFPVARHHGMTAIPYLEEAERPERGNGHVRSPASMWGKFARLSGANLGYPLAGDGREWSAGVRRESPFSGSRRTAIEL